MAKISKKTATRIKSELKKYQKILIAAKSRDINESDTVIIVGDILADVFGYDKYSEITTEFAIRGSYCDLAVKSGEKLQFLIEVKAIGLDLKENHLRQAVNYAANQGINWIVLTNGNEWQVYRVLFQKPIDEELVFQTKLIEVSERDPHVLEMLYVLSKEGVAKGAIEELHKKARASNRFTVAAILQTDPVINVVRREIKRLYKGVRVDADSIREMLSKEILKREVVEGEKAQEALTGVKRKSARAERKKAGSKKETTSSASISSAKMESGASSD